MCAVCHGRRGVVTGPPVPAADRPILEASAPAVRRRAPTVASMAVLIGTSGWQYASWRGRFYPASLPQRSWLEHYAARFQTVEVNNAFYRLPAAATFDAWAARTPDDFVVAVKASRYLSHLRRLRDPAEPVRRLMERAVHLGGQLGPVLVQLPATFPLDLGRLTDTLDAFPAGTKVAFEPRHPSWHVEEVAEALAARDQAFCLSDAPGRVAPRWRTASWGYLRMHAGRAAPAPCYGPTALRRWAEHLAELWSPDEEVHVYFNNDGCGCAVRDARRFAAALRRAGLVPSRVPSARETPVCRPGDSA